MPRVSCRCGQVLSVPAGGPDRVTCPKCSARIRVRRDEPTGEKAGEEGDGFLRFPCVCGRRLKVRVGSASTGPTPLAGHCPDCGAVVPVPSQPASSAVLNPKSPGPETPTEDLGAVDLAALDRWSQSHLAASPSTGSGSAIGAAAAVPIPDPDPVAVPEPKPAVAAVKSEAGLRVCPRCGRPLHLSAVTCRECGTPAPKR